MEGIGGRGILEEILGGVAAVGFHASVRATARNKMKFFFLKIIYCAIG